MRVTFAWNLLPAIYPSSPSPRDREVLGSLSLKRWPRDRRQMCAVSALHTVWAHDILQICSFMSAALVAVNTMTRCLEKQWALTLIWDSRDIQVDLDTRRAVWVSDCCTLDCNIFVIFRTPQKLCACGIQRWWALCKSSVYSRNEERRRGY